MSRSSCKNTGVYSTVFIPPLSLGLDTLRFCVDPHSALTLSSHWIHINILLEAIDTGFPAEVKGKPMGE